MKRFLFCSVMLLAPLATLQAQGPKEIHQWVQQAVNTSLDYHCRAKFGDNAETFTPNPDKLTEKWQRLDGLLAQAQRVGAPDSWVSRDSGAGLNSELIRYFRKVRQWELWLRSSKQDFHAKMDFFLLRIAMEEVGGEYVKQVIDEIPDDLEIKQDLSSVVSAGIQRELDKGAWQLGLETMRLMLIDDLKAINDPTAAAIAEELAKLARKPEYERQWLEKNRPGLLDRKFVESRKRLYALKQTVRSRMSDDKLTQIKACPGVLCRQFMSDYALATRYEEQSMPELALAPVERWVRLLDAAYKEALSWNADTGGASSSSGSVASSGAIGPRLMDILRKTNRVYKSRFSSGGEPFDYVNPVDIGTIQQQSELIKSSGKDFGYVGLIDAVERVNGVAAVKNDLLVVLGKSGIATYDLASGSRRHLIYDLPPDTELGDMVVTKDGRYAYVVTDAPELVRYDLTSGKRDSKFKAPEVPRKDAKLAVSPDGKLIAVGVLGKIATYDTKTGKDVGNFRSQTNLLVYGLEFASSSRSINLCGNGPLNYEYDARSGDKKRERRIVVDKRNNAYNYSLKASQGLLAAAGRGALAVWREGSDKPLFQATFPGDRSQVMARWAQVAPDKEHLLVSHGIWNMKTGENLVRFLPTWNEAAMAMTEDGSRLLIGGEKAVFVVPSCLDPVREPEKPKPEFRTWSDKTGKFKIRALMLNSASGKVTLRKTDGTQIQVPLSVLSDPDRAYVKTIDGN